MKKSKIATALVVALGAVWVGGAWFTGKTAETEYKNEIDKTNAQLAQQFTNLGELGSVITYKNISFERGLFSSTVKDVLELKWNGELIQIPLNSTLYHGPLPLNQLKRFHLKPLMFSQQVNIGKNETTAPLFAMIKNEQPISFEMTMDYHKAFQGNLTLFAGNYADNKKKLAWSDVNVEMNGNQDSDVKWKFLADNLEFTELGKNSGGKVTLKGLHYDADIQQNNQWKLLGIGRQVIKFDELRVAENSSEKDNLVLKNIDFIQDSQLDNEQFVNYRIDGKISDISINNKNLGKLTYLNELNHLDAKTVVKLMQLAQIANPDDPHINQQIMQKAAELLQHQPQLKFAPIQLENAKGKLSLDLNVALANADFNGKHLLRSFNILDVDIKLDKPALVEALSALINDEQRQKELPIEIEKFAQESQAQGFFVNNENNLTLNVKLDKGELKLNGQVIPEEQIQMILFLLAMGMMH